MTAMANPKQPVGTYIARTEDDIIHLPSPVADYVVEAGWQRVRVVPGDESVTIVPLPSPDAAGGHDAEVEAGGLVRIGSALQRQLGLEGQHVMVRFEGDTLRVFVRRVFQTLGFRPG